MRRGSRHNIDRETYCQEAFLYHRRGNALPQSKLTPALVREIRASSEPRKEIARRLGLHYRTIEKVRQYETWIHVK